MAISSNATGLRPGVCTSTTRPTNPYTGQIIFQTDTGTMHNWDGAAWQFLAPTQQRNLLYNGAMQVAQRGTSTASITTSGYYTADRYNLLVSSLGTWTQSVESDAPTGSGFRKSLKMLCTTADASPAAGDYCVIEHKLEGQDVQSLKKGTSSAQQATLSFWAKSGVTGTYIVELRDNNNSRQVSKSYTISSANTWEFKTLTFPADTTGAFTNDNNVSLIVMWWLAAGSNFTSGTLNTVWGADTTANRAVGQSNVAAGNNSAVNYWQITGVQLNVGSVAAPFEFKSFGQELRECQRYYEKTYDYATAPATNTNLGFVGVGGPDSVATTYFFSSWRYKTEKRATPTVTLYDITGNSGKITTWQSGSTTSNVTPSNGNWVNGTNAHSVLHQGSVSGWYYQAVSSAEL